MVRLASKQRAGSIEEVGGVREHYSRIEAGADVGDQRRKGKNERLLLIISAILSKTTVFFLNK